jgi:transketolase N-terminal domain/subunit
MVNESIGQSGCHKKMQELEGHIRYMIGRAGSGHYASSMSALEIMYPLFYEQGVMPDEFILSKGHAAPALYAILYDLGYLTIKEFAAFREYGGLPGHPALYTKGVLCSSGSLGMGISKAIGLAITKPLKKYHVLVGDGELQEGQNWEAIRYLYDYEISNVIVHIDGNGHQYSGKTRSGIGIPDDSKNIIWHRTKWIESNKYLTRPQNPQYTKKIEQYSDDLLKAMTENDKIIALDADLLYDFGLEKIRFAFPYRFIECGISEQHMVSMANGLALAGYIPICHTFAAFYRRAFDQIYNNQADELQIIYVAGLCGEHKQNIGVSHHEGTITSMMNRIGVWECSSLSEALAHPMSSYIRLEM